MIEAYGRALISFLVLIGCSPSYQILFSQIQVRYIFIHIFHLSSNVVPENVVEDGCNTCISLGQSGVQETWNRVFKGNLSADALELLVIIRPEVLALFPRKIRVPLIINYLDFFIQLILDLLLGLVKDFTTDTFSVTQPGSLILEPAILPMELSYIFLFDSKLFVFFLGHVGIILGKVEDLPSICIRLLRANEIVGILCPQSCLAN